MCMVHKESAGTQQQYIMFNGLITKYQGALVIYIYKSNQNFIYKKNT